MHAAGARGFTVVELVVTLAVIAILARIAVPALHGFMMSNSMTSANNQLVASLSYARNQAITQRSSVILCKTANPTASTPTCDTSGSTFFNEGWVIYNTYTDSSGASQTNVLKTVVPNSATNITIKGSSAIKSEVDFNALGFAGSGVASAGTFTAISTTVYLVLCDTRQWANNGQYARVITISTTGQIATATGDKQTTTAVTSCSP